MATKRDYYDILGVSKKAPADEIKRAYRKLALEWHPDKNKSAGAEAKFKEINEAYSVLSNQEKRDAYDRFGHSAFAPGAGAPGGGNPFSGGFGQGPFSYTYTTGAQGGNPFSDFMDPFEIFEQFFGGGFSSGGSRSRRRAYEISITFTEAVHGVTKEITLPKGEAGGGSTKKTVKIPPGVDTGSRIRFDDFDIVIAVESSQQFKREGDDIIIEHPITFSKASLGGIEEVPTIYGDVKIRIPAGTQPGTLIRLRGQGVTHVRGSGKGDEYVKITMNVPTHLSHRQKELLEELEKSFD